jgi:VanZ family protein
MKLVKLVWIWLPPFALMSLIFYFSSKQNISVSDGANRDVVNFLFFKSIHILEYAVLYFLFYRAYSLSFLKSWSNRKIIVISAISTFLYSVIDEVHQTFVPTRTGTLRDIGIDLIGISIMVLYTNYYSKNIRAILR